MRILHATPYFAPAFAYGGPPRSVLGLCRALRHAGADVGVITTTANGDGELPRDATERGTFEDLPVTYLPRSFPKRHFRAASLRATLDGAGTCDLMHVHGCWNMFGWAAARWCRRAGVPYVLSPRGMLHPWSFEHGRARKWLSYRLIESPILRGARFIHATSEDEADVIRALLAGAPGPPIVVVPNGLDDLEAPFPARGVGFREQFGVKPDDFLVLFLGRLHPKKGLATLMAAMRLVLERQPNARLLIAGAGEPRYVRDLQASAQDLIDAGQVAFAGHLIGDERRFALAHADAFALTSHSENFGLAVGEAMAAALPVVVSRECPWPQIEAWRAGFWVENAEAPVADALLALARDRAAARQLGDNGRREIRAHLNWPRIAGEMLDAYAHAVHAT